MKLIAAMGVGAIGLAVAAAQSRPLLRSVTAVRHWALSDTTRVAVEVSGDFEYRSERLHNPERIYYDILNAVPHIAAKRSFTEIVSDRLLTKLRVAETMPGVTRVVLDLAGGAEATASKLTIPNRLIIELRVPAVPNLPTAPAVTQPPVTVSPATLPPALSPVTKMETAPLPPVKTSGRTETADTASMKPLAKPAGKSEGPAGSTLTTSPALPARPGARPVVKAEPVTESAATAPSTPPGPSAAQIVAETSKAARHASNGNTSLVRALGLKLGRVVIDPGHGGHDQGTESAKGLLEKELVLDIAMRVGKLVEERLGAEVVYTRTDDTFVPLEGRTALAEDKKADLFLSIHANSSPISRIAGMETYYLNFTNARDALDVASRENASAQKSISELHDLIQKITLHDKAEESREFAGRIQASLYAFSARNFPGLKDRGIKKAPFVVLIGARIPSVLVEIGFLSNPREEALLHRSDYRQKLAEALFRGISRYADSLSHFQVAKAGNE